LVITLHLYIFQIPTLLFQKEEVDVFEVEKIRHCACAHTRCVAFERSEAKPGKVRSSRAKEKHALLPPPLCNRMILRASSSRATRESEVNLCGVHRVHVHMTYACTYERTYMRVCSHVYSSNVRRREWAGIRRRAWKWSGRCTYVYGHAYECACTCARARTCVRVVCVCNDKRTHVHMRVMKVYARTNLRVCVWSESQDQFTPFTKSIIVIEKE